MKNRRFLQAIAVVLAGTYVLSVSGCEKVVKSAVVEEKETAQSQEKEKKPDPVSEETPDNPDEGESMTEEKTESPDTLDGVSEEGTDSPATADPAAEEGTDSPAITNPAAEEGAGSSDASDPAAEEADTPDVADQVQAPEVYQADFTDTSEGSQLTLHVRANASVEVPDVEGIYLKEAVRSSGDREMMRKWVETLSQGAPVQENEETMEGISGKESILVTGETKIDEIPFTYWYKVFEQDPPALEFAGFNWGIDWGQITDAQIESGRLDFIRGEDAQEEAALMERATKEVEELLKVDGWTDFRIGQKTLMYGNFQGKNGIVETHRHPLFRCERVVDGIPVTYVQAGLYPIYKDPDKLIQEGSSMSVGEYSEAELSGENASKESALEADSPGESQLEDGWRWWEQEQLFVHYEGKGLLGVSYGEPMEIKPYSDEKQFLLPFEEIRQVFENTISAQLSGPAREKLNDYGSVVFMYPDPDSTEVDMEITRVTLGYMRVRSDASSAEGTLIPVWDFFGTWTAKGVGIAYPDMNEPNVSLLTIDARDGSVIQRYRGY